MRREAFQKVYAEAPAETGRRQKHCQLLTSSQQWGYVLEDLWVTGEMRSLSLSSQLSMIAMLFPSRASDQGKPHP